jgi:hypothetical protein
MAAELDAQVAALAPPSARDASLAIVKDREPLVDVAVARGELPAELPLRKYVAHSCSNARTGCSDSPWSL